jgi:hypothetical protein
MRKSLSFVVLVAIAAAGCGTGGAADAPPETIDLTTLPPVATTITMAPTTTAAPNALAAGLPIPPSTTTPPLPTTTTTPPAPVFEYAIHEVNAETVSKTWREDCPLHWDELTMLTLSYWNFDGRPVVGRMVVNTAVVEDVVNIFEKLFAMKFPIERIALVDDYGGDDKEAMRYNVTSGFNCRYVDGTERWSNHAFGLAVDINPLINPWAREGNVLPIEGTRYAADRDDPLPGMINEGDRVVSVFEQFGWSWGGVWGSADYMHFSKPGN